VSGNKQKSVSGAAKRFKRTGSGGFKRKQSHLRHILTKKSTKRKRHLRGIKQAKGYRGARSRVFRVAKQAVTKAGQYAYRDRKAKKRVFRRLWIARINAAARENGMTYSRMMQGLKASGIEVDRKMLADIAIADAVAFTAIVDKAKAGLTQQA